MSPLPFLGFTVTLPDNVTVVELDPQPYSNTKEVLFLNTSATDRVLVKVVDLGSGLPAAGSITSANSTVIPAGASLNLCLGMEGCRMPLGTVAFWAVTPGSKLGIVLLAESGTDIEVNVTYTNGVGGNCGGGC
jgi:hypothetical protein